MKRINKGIFLFTIIVLSLVFAYPSKIYALVDQTPHVKINNITPFVNINDTKNLEVGDLSFSNISFKDYSSTSVQAFGLSGIVKNSSNNQINYTSNIYYFDSNYNMIAQGYNLSTAISGTSNFNQMSNLSVLNGHSVNEIYYYRLSIKIIDNAVLSQDSATTSIPSKNNQYSSYDYVIDKYDINIIVNENNTFDITETITAYFNVSKHGIIRTIPLKNTITRLDGTTSTNRTQVTNVSVDNEYKTSKENGNYKIKIGSASRTLTGEQTYVIKYTYNLGKDPIKDYDELYYNIIGYEWDTVIGNITFSITMPKEFDSSKLGFSSGVKGSTANSNVEYNVSENKITGSYNGILDVGEALTVRCELPEGYFVDAGFPSNPLIYIMFIIPIVGLIITFILWFKYGRDDQVIETAEFYPPKGLNSLDVGFLYKGYADNRDVTSLLIYLANKGYIKIAETEKKSLLSKSKGFKITKLKDYDGANINEQWFMEGLFEYDRTEVTDEMLYDNFFITNDSILCNINNKENKYKIFEKSTSIKSIIVALLMIISILTVVAIPAIDYAGGEMLGITLYTCATYIPFFAIGIFGKMPLPSRILLLGFMIVFFFSKLPTAEVITNDSVYLFGFIIGIVCIIGMIVFFKLMPKRTPYGNEMLGKLRGFKHFLEIAEKEKLEAMVLENPNYFYDILPYTYVLGVSDKWIKKFESISLQAPSWYDSPNAFDIATFSSFMDSTMVSAQSSMSSSPSSDSGGGSSGGGSSGGGSGGGGGSSW